MTMWRELVVVSGLTATLAGCGTVGQRGADAPRTGTAASRPAAAKQAPAGVIPPYQSKAYYKDDGPGENPPANLDAIPDAVPRAEPPHRFANRPYEVLGVAYTPDTSGQPYSVEGLASWYGRKFHGQRTSSGEAYDMYGMTAAHRTLPIPSYVRVTNPANGRSVVLRVNDRGPFHPDRVIDLTYTAAHKLDLLRGVATVRVERIFPEDVPEPLSVAKTSPLGDEAAQLQLRSLAPAPAEAERGIYLQVGAYDSAAKADALMERLLRQSDSRVPSVSRIESGRLVKVRTGPYADAAEANRAADFLARQYGLKPVRPAAASTASASPSPAAPSGPAYWLQLAAFSNANSAETLFTRLKDHPDLPGLERLQSGGMTKVQAGPFATAALADQAATRLADTLGYRPYRLQR